jgi:hypothetical protein
MISLATHVHPKVPRQVVITGGYIRTSFCFLYLYIDIVVTDDRKTSVSLQFGLILTHLFLHFLALCVGCAFNQEND